MAMVRRRGVVRIDLESVLFAPIMFMLTLAATVIGGALRAWEVSSGGWSNIAAIVLGVGAFLCYASWRAWGRGASHLLVDVPGGVVTAISNGKPWPCELDKLGPLQFESYRKPVRRHYVDRFQLRAPGFNNGILIDDFDEKKVRDFQTTLEALVAQSAIHRVLQTITQDMGAFRGGPDVRDEIRRRVPDPELRRSAMAVLANDADSEIRKRAQEHLDAMASVPAPGE